MEKLEKEVQSNSGVLPDMPSSQVPLGEQLRQVVQEYRHLLDCAACFRTQSGPAQREGYSFNF